MKKLNCNQLLQLYHCNNCKKTLVDGLRDLAQDIDSMLQTDDVDLLVSRAGQMQDELEEFVAELGLTNEVY